MQPKWQTRGYVSTDLWKGLAAGLVAGLVACWTIKRFQDVWSRLVETVESLPQNEFRDVWDEFADGLGGSFEAPASQAESEFGSAGSTGGVGPPRSKVLRVS